MNHYNSIKQLFPLDLGECSDAEMAVEGAVLDQALVDLESTLSELFASTSLSTIQRWEREYGVIPTPGQSITARRGAIVAKIVQRSSLKYGGLRKSLFVSIAAAMGYIVEIMPSADFFRADINKAGDSIYDSDSLWVMTVYVSNASEGQDLEAVFNDIRPPYLNVSYIYS